MLNVPTEFPQAGSTAYCRGSAEQVRILQRNYDGTVLVQRTGPDARFAGASRETRVALADLFPRQDEACEPPRRRRRAKVPA